jgi:hypothetical protein
MVGVYFTGVPSKVRRKWYTRASEGESTGSTGTYTYLHAHIDLCAPRYRQRDLTWNIVIDFFWPLRKGVEEGWCVLGLPALGHRRPERSGRSLTGAEMRGDLVGERMRSDASRSGIVIDVLVKWVALTLAVKYSLCSELF